MSDSGEVELNVRCSPIIRFGELVAFVDMLQEKGFPDDTPVQVEVGDKMHWLSSINSLHPADGTESRLKLVCTPQDRQWWRLTS